MALNPTQLQTLKTDILADATLAAHAANGAIGPIVTAYNINAVPDFWVFKSSVVTDEIGKTVNYVAVEALTDINTNKLTTFITLNPQSFDPRKADIRSFFVNVFSGALGGQGQTTRDALDLLWRKLATRGQKLFATGTGSTVAPATMGYEPSITDSDVQAALALP